MASSRCRTAANTKGDPLEAALKFTEGWNSFVFRIPPDLTRDETAKQRFLQEAQAASALDHPNIHTIHVS